MLEHEEMSPHQSFDNRGHDDDDDDEEDTPLSSPVIQMFAGS